MVHVSLVFLKDPACQNISTELHCYLLDPFCFIKSTSEETTNEVKETSTHEVEETTSYEENDNTFITLGLSLASVFILVLVVCFVVVRRIVIVRRIGGQIFITRRSRIKRKKGLFIIFDNLRSLLFKNKYKKQKLRQSLKWQKMGLIMFNFF